MRLTAFVLFVLGSALHLTGQVHIGRDWRPKFKEATGIKPEQLEAFKRTTTILFYYPQDEAELPRMKAALDTLWTITPIEFKPEAEFIATRKADVPTRKYSFLHMELDVIPNGSISSYHACLKLLVPEPAKKGTGWYAYAGVEMDASDDLLSKLEYGTGKNVESVDDIFREHLSLTDWAPGIVVNYLACMNKLLVLGEPRGYTSPVEPARELRQLKKDTLFVCGNFDLGQDYPYPWKVVSVTELSHRLLVGGRRTLFFTATKYHGGMILAVHDSADGALVYNEFSLMKHSVKSSDFKALAKAIKGD